MSRDLGRDVPDLEKLYARKLQADFSYPILESPEDNTLKGPQILESPRKTFRTQLHCLACVWLAAARGSKASKCEQKRAKMAKRCETHEDG